MPVKRSRNTERFPDDSMFQLNDAEFTNLRSQIVTSSWCGLRRAAPYAFVEQGVAMLSSVLYSDRAVHAYIGIMHAFVRLRSQTATLNARRGQHQYASHMPSWFSVLTSCSL